MPLMMQAIYSHTYFSMRAVYVAGRQAEMSPRRRGILMPPPGRALSRRRTAAWPRRHAQHFSSIITIPRHFMPQACHERRTRARACRRDAISAGLPARSRQSQF